MKKQSAPGIIPCECLDFVEAAHRHRAYPLMYCRMEIAGHLDISRLKQSVAQSSKIVPELLCSYDFQKGVFVHSGHTADDVVKYGAEWPPSLLRPDLSVHPQLQILISPKNGRSHVIAVMSHILADGAGFLQYLYLLAALYNGEPLDENIQNVRDGAPLLAGIHVLAPTQQTRHNRAVVVSPLRSLEKGDHFFCFTTQISAGRMAVIHQKAQEYGASFNDVFLTAYARVVARLEQIHTVVLPCPADLRRFHPEWNVLSVANMTGVYRRIAVEIPYECPFSKTLQQVHIEMELQRSRCRCFDGIEALNRAFRIVPRTLMGHAIRSADPLPHVSYTNCGVIDHERLRFQGCTVQTCFLTGTYRLPPDFQLTVSTFQKQCTLNCALIGSADGGPYGPGILEQVKREILNWSEEGRNGSRGAGPA